MVEREHGERAARGGAGIQAASRAEQVGHREPRAELPRSYAPSGSAHNAPSCAQHADSLLTVRRTRHRMARMPRSDRRLRLVRRLREDGRASVDVLARDLGVTPSTIRRDLARLADDGNARSDVWRGGAAPRPAPRASPGRCIGGGQARDRRRRGSARRGRADDRDLERVDDPRARPPPRGPASHRHHERPRRRQRPPRPRRDRARRPRRRRAPAHALDARPPRRAGAPRASRRHPVHGDRRPRPRPRPHERLDPRDPHRPRPPPQRPDLRRPRRRHEVRPGGPGVRVRLRRGRHRRHRRPRRPSRRRRPPGARHPRRHRTVVRDRPGTTPKGAQPTP